MSESKPTEDGFKEIGEGEAIDPLSSAIQITPAKDNDQSNENDSRSKGDLTLKAKLTSVFGADVMFDDQQSKHIQVHRPKSRPPAENSPSKTDSMIDSPHTKSNLLSPIPHKAGSKQMDSPVKTPREEAAKLSLQAKPTDDDEEEQLAGDKKLVKMRYKDLVANSDQFEEDRIEATYVDANTSIIGTLKLGQFMVELCLSSVGFLEEGLRKEESRIP